MNADARHQWCPTVITASASPGNPCRRPFGIRYPDPSIEIIVQPSSVVEGCPSPRIVRDPRVPILCINPVTIRSIRCEAAFYARNPDISISTVVHPSTIRLKFIVKNLQRNAALCFCIRDASGCHQYKDEYRHPSSIQHLFHGCQLFNRCSINEKLCHFMIWAYRACVRT